jgi:hypothetical protein
MMMRFRLRGQMRPEALLIETYHFPRTTVQLHQAGRGQLRWSCNCAAFQQEHTLREELWCEHIMRAAALRSIGRLMRWRAVI